MVNERRKSPRVVFEHGMKSHVTGIDMTWRRPCVIHDISQGGAKLTIKGSTEDLNLTEFFLVLSLTGAVHRRCRLVRVAGEQIGVMFQKQADDDSLARTA